MTGFPTTAVRQILDNNNENKKELRRYGSSTEGDDSVKRYRKFAVGYSTERHFRIADHEEPGFYGAYGNIRKELDYSYHVHYRKGELFREGGIGCHAQPMYVSHSFRFIHRTSVCPG